MICVDDQGQKRGEEDRGNRGDVSNAEPQSEKGNQRRLRQRVGAADDWGDVFTETRDRAIITPIHTPQPTPRSRPTAARNKVIVRFCAISPPENRSTNAAPTASGDGKKSLLTFARCRRSATPVRKEREEQFAPSNARLRQGLVRNALFLPPGRECLAPHREPDLVTDAVEWLRNYKFFARTAPVERNGKFFDDLTRSCRHDADAI